MPSNVDIFHDDNDEQPCGRCDDPGSVYCTATGMPHTKPEKAPKEFHKVTRWVKTKKSLRDLEETKNAFLSSLAEMWNIPRPSLKLVSVIPTFVFVSSPNRQMQCAGLYELQLDPNDLTEAPELLNSAPVWKQVISKEDVKDGFTQKSLSLSSKNRWAISNAPGSGPFFICAANDGLRTPLEVDSWACNEPGKWVADHQITVVSAGGHKNGGLLLKVQTVERNKSPVKQILEKEEAPKESAQWVPGEPGSQETTLHIGQRVFVRDTADEQWRTGEVIGINRHGRVLVQPESDVVQWDGEYDWKDVRPLTAADINVRIGGQYLTKDAKGDFFLVRLVKVSDDNKTCTCLVHDGTAEGLLWEDVHVSNLIEKDSLRADFKRWRGLTTDKAPVPVTRLDFVYALGDAVEVRDDNNDPWLDGKVVGYDEKEIVKATIRLDGGKPWARKLYRPLVLVNKWVELDKPHKWNQVRRKKDPEIIEEVPGAKRAIIVGISYHQQKGELHTAVPAARQLAQSLATNGFAGEVRTLTDSNAQSMPTRSRIEAALKWLVRGAQFGDSLFFGFIGRAYTVMDDKEGIEAALLPLDHSSAGLLTDDFLVKTLLNNIPPGVKLTCLFDTNPPTGLWDLPYRVVTDTNGCLKFSHGGTLPSVTCSLTTLSLVQAPDKHFNEQKCGQLTEAVSDLLERNSEPVVPSMIISLGIDLEGLGVVPQLHTNTVGDGELVNKQFFIGSYPRWEEPAKQQLEFHTIELSRGGDKGANGTYALVKPRNKAKPHYYVQQDDSSYQMRHQSTVWWIVRDLGSSCDTLYQSTVAWPFPPVSPMCWRPVNGRPSSPLVELWYGGAKAAAGTAALDIDITATLVNTVYKGKKKWMPGEHVTAVQTGDTYAVRMRDGAWVHEVSPEKIQISYQTEEWVVGDIVSVRDDENEDWLIGRIVRLDKKGEPFVKPLSDMAVAWDNPGGYLFRITDKVKVGVRFEGKDAYGKWWPITITEDNGDGTFKARVEKGPRKTWEKVHPSNIRRTRKMSTVSLALKKEIERWNGEPPSHSPPVTDLQVGDRVRVRDTVTEEWLEGKISEMDSEGFPLVKPDSWSRGPYRWAFIHAASDEPKKEPEPIENQPWPDRVPSTLVVMTPPHTKMCPHRKVRCIRFTPFETKDSNCDFVSVGCIQLILSPDKDFPNALLLDGKEYTGGKRKTKEHLPDDAAVISHGFWKCPMPASLVFTLNESACIFGYRVQTAMDGLGNDPQGWKLEVADARGGGWVLWDQQVDGKLPIDRLGWSKTFRPGTWYAQQEGYTASCSTAKCQMLRSLSGEYDLKGNMDNAIHGRPVYERQSPPGYIYLAPNNSWMVSTSLADVASGSGVLRAVDSSVPCYLSPGWELYVVHGGKHTWQHDPDISVTARASLKAIKPEVQT
eukprot:TRINITY_DN21361_c0_g1_i1.p1 TRINITY_DN21361_c0_g1~~TRINITY_DN21361_c0_g1_i1.p1  ORF type:complete len:1404 (+),score=296.75 TRINITY_DN21361_c0_g1_i1:34-4245(+)